METIPSFKLNTQEFRGTFETLYEQFREHKLDLTQLKLQDIVHQYAAYINDCVAAEYELGSFCHQLGMCSKIILLRSYIALPELEPEIKDDSIYQLEDERVKRLVHYNRIKRLADRLKIRQSESFRFLGKEASPYDLYNEFGQEVEQDPLNYINKLDINRLTQSFNNILEQINYKRPLSTKVVRQEVSPHTMKTDIIKFCKTSEKKNGSFERFLIQFSDNITSLITCFLVILDLISSQHLKMVVNKERIFLQYQ